MRDGQDLCGANWQHSETKYWYKWAFISHLLHARDSAKHFIPNISHVFPSSKLGIKRCYFPFRDEDTEALKMKILWTQVHDVGKKILIYQSLPTLAVLLEEGPHYTSSQRLTPGAESGSWVAGLSTDKVWLHTTLTDMSLLLSFQPRLFSLSLMPLSRAQREDILEDTEESV